MLFVAAMAAMSVNAQGPYDLSLFSKVNIGANKDATVASTVNNDGVVVIETGDKVSQTWDNQFFVSANETLTAGTPFTFSMEVKAVSATTVLNSQVHNNPGEYVGNLDFNIACTNDWTTYTSVNVMAKDAKTIAFNLSEGDGVANVYYIKNITWAPFSATYTVDTVKFNFAGELNAENFMVFTSSVSTSAADFNSVSATVNTSVSPTVAFSSVSTTVFASISKTLVDNKTIANVGFKLDGNNLILDKELGEKDNVFVAYNNFVVKANYVAPRIIETVEVAAAAEFSVYPNPVNDVLNVACEAGVANVAIFDVAGRMVKVSNESVINVADLKAGMYIVKVTDLNGANGTTKIMK